MKKIVIIVGSLRKNSFNLRMAREVERMLSAQAEVHYLEYSDIPYMNQDVEFPPPESVKRVRTKVQQADGIWICTPEYNFNVPGGLKNLLDWLSRPLRENDWDGPTAIKGKCVTISGVGGRNATRNARKALYDILRIMSAEVVADTGTGVALDITAFATDEMAFSSEDKEALAQQARAFLKALDT